MNILLRLSTFQSMETRALSRRLSSVGHLHRRAALVPAPFNPRTPVSARQLSSLRSSKGGPSGSEDDKSWGEIIQDAAGVARSVFNKIKDTATSLLPTAPPASPSSSSSAKPAPRSTPDEAPLSPGFGGGLLPNLVGRAVGGLVAGALSSLSAQLEEAARAQQGAYEEAVARLQTSARLRDRFGTVTVGPPVSQSSSSSSINGVVTKQVVLVVPVYGSAGGSGTAQVAISEGAQVPGGRSMQITVRTADGSIISVDGPGGSSGDGGGGRGRGNVIDVEFREVK